MAVTAILLNDIINAPAIIPGAGSWGARNNDRLGELAIPWRLGLLSRAIDIEAAVNESILVVPIGHYCMVTEVWIQKTELVDDLTSNTYKIGHTASANEWNSGFNATYLANVATQILQVWPTGTGTGNNALTPIAVQRLDGDVAARDELFIRRASGVTADKMIVWCFGHCWPK